MIGTGLPRTKRLLFSWGLAFLLFLPSGLWAIGIGDDEPGPEPDISSADITSPDVSSSGSGAAPTFKIPVVTFQKTQGQPVLDGVLKEGFWQRAVHTSIDLEMYPTRFAKPVVDTQVYIAVSASHLFIAFNALDPDVSQLRSAPRTRDGVKDDDFVSIVLDPTGTGTKQYEFRINPHGSLTDVLQDSVSDRYIYDWDTDWTGAAHINEDGYSAELAIPLQSIKFPVQKKGEGRKWLIMLKRSYPRSVDRTFVKPVFVGRAQDIEAVEEKQVEEKPIEEASASSSLQQGISGGIAAGGAMLEDLIKDDDGIEEILPAGKAAVEGDARSRLIQSIEFTPYYIYHRDDQRDLGQSLKQVDNHGVNEAGFTSNIHIGTDKSVGITVNPNFTEVEADIARDSINNPFAVFQPEKRDFFHSGGELYNSSMPIVYTRNVVAPEIGVSYSQSGSDTAGGFFWTNDRETSLIMPDTLGSSQVSIVQNSESAAARYQQVFDKQTVGLLGTLRTGEDGYHNYVGGIDGIYNFGLDDKLRYQLLYSDTQYPESIAADLCNNDSDCTQTQAPDYCPLGSCTLNAYVLRADPTETLKGHALRLNYKHDGPNSLYWFNYYDISRDFRADLGFAQRTDVRVYNAAYGHKWYFELPDNEGKARIQTYGVYRRLNSYAGDEIESSVSLFTELRGWKQTVFRFGPVVRERAVNRINQNSLELGDNAPLFDERFWIWYYEVAPSVQWTFNLDGRYGELADPANLVLGDMREFKPRVRFRYGNFEFRVEAALRDFEVSGGELYEERFYTLGATYLRNQRFSHRLLLLHDVTRRNLDLWLSPSVAAKQESTSFEYSFVYTPDNYWTILTGVKFGIESDSALDEKGLTDREVFLKIERNFDFLL